MFEQHRTGMYLLTVSIWALAFSLFYAVHVIKDLKAGKGRRVDVDVVAGTLRAPTDTVKPLLLGTTQKFVFLYDERSRTTTVIPTDNIAQIRYQRRKP